ncbi:MAG: DUF5057 domain-containing protein [Lachnospiraceae bacterium]|nr:DUF5057 domain-containing protein [Lachnospiraceae bacterium]
MAIKNYVIKNKRKSTCIFVMLMFLLTSIFVVIHTRNTNAGVYVKDEDGKYKQIFEINVLEIVAQNGQQVLGYTVKGQEPITIEKIESYDGPANLSTEDFRNATGYDVIRNTSSGKYEVKQSLLNTSFNDNILGESMSDGEIIVKAIPASELTTTDIHWADLIYINSNDSHSNLLYYYDQVMCDGAMGIEEGDIGASYNETYFTPELKKEIAVKAISSSAGIDNAGEYATEQMFLYFNSSSYIDSYYEFYIEKLEQAEYESLIAETFDETCTKVENFIVESNKNIENESYNTLYTISRKTDEYTEQDKENIRESLKTEIYGRYYDDAIDEYTLILKEYPKGILKAQIREMMSRVGGTKTLEALNSLLLYKNMVNDNVSNGNINDEILGTDEYGLTESDYEVLVSNFLMINIDNVKEELVNDYIVGLLSPDFEYTVANAEVIKTLINDINESKISSILEEVYSCISNEDNALLFAEDAEKKLSVLDANGYNPYDCQEYVDNITTIEDADEDGKISIEEFETYVSRFVNTSKNATYSADIKWKIAETLYSAVGAEEVALMYNANLINNKELLGDYTKDLSLAEDSFNNKNNMYKMLLVLRQLRYDYYKANIQSKIDSNGFYYKDGYNSETNTFIGEGVDSWNMYTFLEGTESDFNNRDKYREPNVVGSTFSKNGNEGLAGCYVQNRVYSYMGDQFFGGEAFVSYADSESANFKSKNTAGTNFALTADNVLDNPNLFVGKTKGDIIRYILEVSLLQLDSPLRVLEIQPTASVSALSDSDDSGLYDEFTATIKTCYNNWYLYADNNNTSITASSSKKSTWHFKKNSDGTYIIYHNDTGKAIDISGASTANGSDVLIWNYHGNNNQRWKIVKKGSGYSFISALSDSCALDQDLNNLSNMQIYTTSNNVAQQFVFEDVNVISSSGEGKQRLLEYIGIDIARADLVQVTTMSVKEFNTRNEDLISNYDLIYFGIDSGYQVVNDYGGVIRTKYNDEEMTGLVYTGIGDKYTIKDHLRGTTAGDYYKVESELPKEFTAYIQSVYNDRYLHVSSNSNGTEIKASNSNRTLWRFKYNAATKGYYIYLENTYNASTQLLMGVSGTSDGTRVKLRSYGNENAKRWTIMQNRSGYKFIPQNNTNSALDKDTGTDDIMQIYGNYTSNEDHSARQFRIEIVDVKNTSTASIGEYKKATEYSTYKYWLENFTYPLRNNPIESWNLTSNPDNNRWFLKSGSMDYATTRLSGNDLTVKRMNDLLEYVKAGYPVMMPEEIFYCDTDRYIDFSGDESYEAASKWRYVDVNSKMYNFITTIKKLGYDSTTNEYTGVENGEKVFDDGYKYANIIIDKASYAKYGRNPENLPTESKFEGGLSYAIKRSARVDFKLISCPTEYNKNIDSATNLGQLIEPTSPEYRTFKYELQLVSNSKSMEWVKENYNFKVCVDKSGTGRYEDMYVMEIEPRVVFDMENNIVTLTGNWPGNMEGFMPWKVVAYSKNNPNSNYTYSGFSAFRITKLTDIYVLWIDTHGSKTLTLDFHSLVDKYQNELKTKGILEYNIKLVTVTVDDYKKLWNSESSTKVYNKKNTKITVNNVLNNCSEYKTIGISGNLDKDVEFNMLVFGYCDSYPGLDINNLAAQHNMDYFIESGKSILYVHDNSSFLTTLNYYTKESNDNTGSIKNSNVYIPSDWNWGRYNTAFLRDTLGQDAYGITFDPSVFNEQSANYDPDIANTRKYINSENQQDYRGFTEVCTFIYEHNSDNKGKQGNDLYTSTLHSSSPISITDWQHTYTVEQMNKGQLSEYPYVIGNKIDVRQTHNQYTLLNLEDEELTVWYTLGYDSNKSGDKSFFKYTKGDGANNYYIYSKNNITYTGAGHSTNGGECVMEQKLFFNTVIASIKAGNFDPAIDFADASVDSSNNFYVNHVDDENVTISFRATDYDGRKGETGSFTESKIYLDVNGDNIYNGSDIILYDYENGANISQIYSTNTDTAGNYIIMGDELKGSNIINTQKYQFILKNEWINQINETLVTSGNSIYKCPIVIQVTDSGIKGDPETKTTVSNRIFIKRIKNIVPSIFDLN